MEFSSLEFIVRFLPIFLIIYYLVPVRFRNPVLFFGSVVFYAFGNWKDAILLLLSLTFNYALVRLMDSREKTKRRIILLILLCYNVGLLCIYKYSMLRMPLGISFYTFTILSYVLDVYWKKEEAVTDYIELGAYILLFPKLISGPITKFHDFIGQLRTGSLNKSRIELGLSVFIAGLGFKMIIANHLAILWRDIQGIGFESISTPLAWFGAVGYSVQLFFDFQGYSLMAIGVGYMLGFELPMNFNHPYRAKSVGEYYRRWHISLGQWFRDYIYIPLGGNRKGSVRTGLNLVIVWIITGMWHGVTANFLIWGLVLVTFILLEKFCIGGFLQQHTLIARLYILLVIPLTWVVFAIQKLPDLMVYFTRLFPFFGSGIAVNGADYLKYGRTYGLFLLLALVVSLPAADRLWEKKWNTWWMKVILFAVFWFCIYEMATGKNNPFMYFSF